MKATNKEIGLTWEQQVEYRKVHQWGVDFNNEFNIPPAEELVEEIIKSGG